MGHASLAIVLAFAALTALSTPVRYDGHRVVRLHVGSTSTADLLERIGLDAEGTPSPAEVLSHDGQLVLGATASIRMSPSAYREFAEAQVEHVVTVDDLQEQIEASMTDNSRERAEGDWYDHFHSFDEIVERTRQFAVEYPEVASFLPQVATSVENRSIPALRLGRGNATHNISLLLSGIHAREWIGPAVLVRMVRDLLAEYAGNTSNVRHVLDTQTVYVVPCYNPDGYEYSRTHNRLWRKNRGLVNGTAVGIDLNRNWDDGHWGIGASSNPSTNVYMGPRPWSEPETRGISSWILSLGSNVRTFIDFHSNSGQFLRPYGWTTDDCPDETYLRWVGDTMAALTNTRNYTSVKGMDLYPVGGATDSWAYEQAHILHSYTVEIAGVGFVVSDTEIALRTQQMYPAVRFLLGLTATPGSHVPDFPNATLSSSSSDNETSEISNDTESSSHSHSPVPVEPSSSSSASSSRSGSVVPPATGSSSRSSARPVHHSSSSSSSSHGSGAVPVEPSSHHGPSGAASHTGAATACAVAVLSVVAACL
eukprot:m51a1_g2020 putative mast cell carboxypeptidase a (537) ;mRNA; r:1286327-1288222